MYKTSEESRKLNPSLVESNEPAIACMMPTALSADNRRRTLATARNVRWDIRARNTTYEQSKGAAEAKSGPTRTSIISGALRQASGYALTKSVPTTKAIRFFPRLCASAKSEAEPPSTPGSKTSRPVESCWNMFARRYGHQGKGHYMFCAGHYNPAASRRTMAAMLQPYGGCHDQL